MKKMLGLTLFTCIVLFGCTKQSPTKMPTTTVEPDASPAEIVSSSQEEYPKATETYIAKVVSASDSGMRRLSYIVVFEITQGPSAGKSLGCLIDGYSDHMEILGNRETWWRDFTYRRSEYKGYASFEIICRRRDDRHLRRLERIYKQQYERGLLGKLDLMELVSIRAVQKDAIEYVTPSDMGELIRIESLKAENTPEISIVSVERTGLDDATLIIQLQWSVDRGRVFYDTYNLDYHYKINEESWKNNGPIRWRHPFRGVNEITKETPHSHYWFLDLGDRNLDTIKHIQVKTTHNKRIKKEVWKQADNWTEENIEKYNRAWFGSLCSQKYRL